MKDSHASPLLDTGKAQSDEAVRAAFGAGNEIHMVGPAGTWFLADTFGYHTPHMARHFGGKHLNAGGAGLKTIMGALDHADPTSSIRYQDADLDIVRSAIDRLDRLEPPRALGKKLDKTARSRRNA